MRRTVALAILGALLAGCDVNTRFEGRSLTGLPLPAGKMAMLPPLHAPDIQYKPMALAFVRELASGLRDSGVYVFNEDLGGALQPIEIAPDEADRQLGGPGPTTRPAADVLAQLRQVGYRTACLPVLKRYGYYPVYVPPRLATVPDDDWGFRTSYLYARRRYGWGVGTEYHLHTTAVIPGYMTQVTMVAVEFHVIDVATARKIYYFVGEGDSQEKKPSDIEKNVLGGLRKKFRSAVGIR